MTDPYSGKQLVYKDYHGAMDDEIFNSPALMQDHYISINGGNDKGTFAASLGYYDEDGQVVGTGYQRFNGSLNGSYKLFHFDNKCRNYLFLVYTAYIVMDRYL